MALDVSHLANYYSGILIISPIINVKLTFSDPRLRFYIYAQEAAPIITLSSRAVTVTRSSLHVISVTLGKEPEFSTWRSIER